MRHQLVVMVEIAPPRRLAFCCLLAARDGCGGNLWCDVYMNKQGDLDCKMTFLVWGIKNIWRAGSRGVVVKTKVSPPNDFSPLTPAQPPPPPTAHLHFSCFTSCPLLIVSFERTYIAKDLTLNTINWCCACVCYCPMACPVYFTHTHNPCSLPPPCLHQQHWGHSLTCVTTV